MNPSEITADNYPIGNNNVIRLLTVSQVELLSKGTKLFSVGGTEIIIGKSNLDLETHVFGRSKYGELLPNSTVKPKNKK